MTVSNTLLVLKRMYKENLDIYKQLKGDYQLFVDGICDKYEISEISRNIDIINKMDYGYYMHLKIELNHYKEILLAIKTAYKVIHKISKKNNIKYNKRRKQNVRQIC